MNEESIGGFDESEEHQHLPAQGLAFLNFHCHRHLMLPHHLFEELNKPLIWSLSSLNRTNPPPLFIPLPPNTHTALMLTTIPTRTFLRTPELAQTILWLTLSHTHPDLNAHLEFIIQMTQMTTDDTFLKVIKSRLLSQVGLRNLVEGSKLLRGRNHGQQRTIFYYFVYITTLVFCPPESEIFFSSPGDLWGPQILRRG